MKMQSLMDHTRETAISDAPLVSVITPCYNAEPFVAETIASVGAQTYPHVEHIVVDDASTDGSWEVIQRHAHRLTAIRLPENRGGSHARNRGAEIARGAYFMFLDADDVLGPTALDGLVAALRNEGEVAVCRWQHLEQREQGWRTVTSGVQMPDPAGDPLRGWLTGQSWAPPCAVLWQRLVYARLGGWDESITLNDDGDLMMRALLAGVCLVVAEHGESFYRSHGPTRISVSTNAFSETKLRSQFRVLEKVEAAVAEQRELAAYAEALGVAYQDTARLAFREGYRELGRQWQRRGEALAGRRAVSPTLAGKVLTGLVGMERKEAIVAALARCGLATRGRRLLLALRREHARRSGGR